MSHLHPSLTCSLGTVTINSKARQYINQVLSTKRLSYGTFCQQFENLFAKLHQTKYAILCSSGTAAIHIILEALKIKYQWSAESEILVPATTFVATINAVIQAGLKPIFVDVESDSFNLDPNQLANHISARTVAILPVHLFGKPSSMDDICHFAHQHHLLVVEDACEAMAALYKKKMVGNWGIAGAFSTNSAHILATGIGGVITTNHKQLAILMRSLINHGRDPLYISIDDDDNLPDKDLKKIIQARYRFNQIGYSYRIGEMEAAIGLSQLEEVDYLLTKRKANVTYLNKLLNKAKHWLNLPQQLAASDHAYLAYPLTLTSASLKQDPNCYEKLILFLERNNIETRPLMPALNQPAYRHLKIKLSNYPVAHNLLTTGFYIGCHQELSKHQLKYMADTICRFFDEQLEKKRT